MSDAPRGGPRTPSGFVEPLFSSVGRHSYPLHRGVGAYGSVVPLASFDQGEPPPLFTACTW